MKELIGHLTTPVILGYNVLAMLIAAFALTMLKRKGLLMASVVTLFVAIAMLASSIGVGCLYLSPAFTYPDGAVAILWFLVAGALGVVGAVSTVVLAARAIGTRRMRTTA